MPTARPIISASVGEELLTLVTRGGRGQPGEADDDADQGRDERDAGGQRRAEGDREDHEGHDDAERLGDRQVHALLLQRGAAEARPQLRALGHRRGLGERVLGLLVEHGDVGVELHLDQRVAAVVGDGRPAVEGVARRRHVLDVGQPGDQVVDLLPGVAVREPLALGRHDDHLGRGAGGLREALLERLQALLRLGAGDGELVVERDAGDADQAAHAEHDEQRGEQDAPRVRAGPAAPAVEGCRHGCDLRGSGYRSVCDTGRYPDTARYANLAAIGRQH